MSVSVSRADGRTVLTLTSDQSSACPPLCQLLGALCYSPGLCSLKRRLLRPGGGPQAKLGALWIITGFLHLGLGLIFLLTRGAPYWRLKETYFSVWLGLLLVFFGLSCVLSEKVPSPILILLNIVLNLTGAALSVLAIVWFAEGLENVGFYEMCWSEDYDYWNSPRATLSPDDKALLERCQEARLILRTFSISISILLVTLSSVDVCLGLSAAIISFKTLLQRPELNNYKPVPQEDTAMLHQNQDLAQEPQEAKAPAQDLQENKAIIQNQEPQEAKAPAQDLQQNKAIIQNQDTDGVQEPQ